MLEYEDVFGNAQDAYEHLKKKYDVLKHEYNILYNTLAGDLEEDIRIKRHLIDRYQKDVNDLNMRYLSIKKAKDRTLTKEG